VVDRQMIGYRNFGSKEFGVRLVRLITEVLERIPPLFRERMYTGDGVCFDLFEEDSLAMCGASCDTGQGLISLHIRNELSDETIRVWIAHELGHFLHSHQERSEKNEREAERFARRLGFNPDQPKREIEEIERKVESEYRRLGQKTEGCEKMSEKEFDAFFECEYPRLCANCKAQLKWLRSSKKEFVVAIINQCKQEKHKGRGA